jgi:hypothetical protein
MHMYIGTYVRGIKSIASVCALRWFQLNTEIEHDRLAHIQCENALLQGLGTDTNVAL